MKSHSAGFTLLEVLVALAVLALSLSAAIQAAGDYTGNQAYLRDRTFAEWVARNELVRLQVTKSWPSIGQSKGDVEFPESGAEGGGREWRWVMQVTQTPEQNLRRVDIEVFPLSVEDDESPLMRLSGFLRKS